MANNKVKKKLSGDHLFGIIMTALVILILLSLFLFSDKLRRDNSNAPEYTSNTEYNIDIKNEPVLGDKNAPVTIVEYGDYKCPACGYFTNNIMTQLDADYIATGKIKFVFKNFPFIYTDSARAALYAEGVYDKLGNDAFWKFHKTIYEYQNTIYADENSQNEHKDMLTEKYLNKTVVDLFGKEKASSLKNIIDNDDYEKEVKTDYKQGKNDDVSSTPSIYVNGKKVYDPLSYDSVKGAIEEALNKGDVK